MMGENWIPDPHVLDPLKWSAQAVPLSHLRCSVLSAGVVWLDTEHNYIVTQEEASSINGKCIFIDHVCWLEMGPYVFPQPDAEVDAIPAGCYYLVMRMKAKRPRLDSSLDFFLSYESDNHSTPVSSSSSSFPARLTLPPCAIMGLAADWKVDPSHRTLLSQLIWPENEIPVRFHQGDGKWRRVIVGRIDLPTTCKSVKVQVRGRDSLYWKSGLWIDYLELINVSFSPHKLETLCAMRAGEKITDSGSLPPSFSSDEGTDLLAECLELPKKLAADVKEKAMFLNKWRKKKMKGENVNLWEARESDKDEDDLQEANERGCVLA